MRIFDSIALARTHQFHMTYAQRLRQFVECNDRWIAPTLLQAANVLLAKSGYFGKFLLREAIPFPDPSNIPAHQFAHIHARRSAHYIL